MARPRDHDRLRGGDARADRAVLVVEHTDRLDRLHPLCRRDRLRARGDSWLRSAPREFALLALVSIPLWLVFEFYNLVIRNWHYVGLPENLALRYFGYAWSFATIWPALFVGADLISVVRTSQWAGGRVRQVGKPAIAEVRICPTSPVPRLHPTSPTCPTCPTRRRRARERRRRRRSCWRRPFSSRRLRAISRRRSGSDSSSCSIRSTRGSAPNRYGLTGAPAGATD